MLRLTSRSVRSYSTKVWSDFSKRPASLKLIDSKAANDIFKGIDPSVGPSSLSSQPDRQLKYYSPVAIDETFQAAYELLEEEAAKIYRKIDKTNSQKDIESLLVKAEQFNPEVIFNIENSPQLVDRDHPVYRKYLKEQWVAHDQMLTMQRLEQLHVIPDTMPTLDPVAEVKIKFPHNTEEEFSKWIEPGTVLPSFAVNKPPTIQVQEFEKTPENQLYTVLIVNPDTPDLSTNQYKTTLHYGLCNVALSNSDNIIDTKKLLSGEGLDVLHDFEPLVPEKNAQTQRSCVWVFRQGAKTEMNASSTSFDSENFDIRDFAEQNGLTAVGASVWRQRFDRSVNKVREEFGLPKGKVYHRVRKPNPVIDTQYSNVI